jgi:hypothetical protein
MPIIDFGHVREWLIKMKIDEMRYYLDDLIKSLNKMEKEFNQRTEEQARQIVDDQEREEFYDFTNAEYWRYKETFPRIFLNSFHVSSYSLLESETLAMARDIGKKQKQVFDVFDIKGGDYLNSASLYIERLTGIKANQFGIWNTLKDAQRLRNIIVHLNGRLSEPNDINLAKRLNVFNDGSLDYPVVFVSVDYSKLFLDSISAFLTDLLSQLEKGKYL